MAIHPGSHSSQSTDEENSRALPSVTDRSDSVRMTARGSLQAIPAEDYRGQLQDTGSGGDMAPTSTRKGKPTAL